MKILARIWVLIALSVFAPLSAQADVSQIEVLVDVHGNDPQDAQKKATEYAKKRAFFLLLSKLSPDKAEMIARSLTTEQIFSYVRGYEILQDRLAWNRYTAKYRVSVSEDMVSRLLVSGSDMDNSDFNPVLVLPVLETESQLMLWEGDNIWRSIWNSVALEKGDGILIMPYGDPTDQQMLDSTTVLTYGYDYLQAIGARYGAAEVVVALAKARTDKDPIGVEVTLRRLGDRLDKIKDMYFTAEDDEETAETVMNRAVRGIADQLKEVAKEYQGEQLRRIVEASRQLIKVQFRRLSDWVHIKERLSQLPRVVRLDVGVIDIRSAEATLLYNGDELMMMKILKANGLDAEVANGVWNITLN